MKKIWFIVITCMFITSCVNTTVIKEISVEDAKQASPINGVTAGCSGMGLTRDCSSMNGATRVVVVKGKNIRVSANDAGTTILLMHDTNECGLTEVKCQTDVNNRNYQLLKTYYLTKNVSINKVETVAAGKSVAGYLLQLNSDGYSIL